jgi:hypothetical protein
MTSELLNITAKDGSRQFASLPESRSWYALRDHLTRLPGVTVTEFLTDGFTEAWIDFSFRGHSFTVNNQWGEYWFFVRQPECPDAILSEVTDYCRRFLAKRFGQSFRRLWDTLRAFRESKDAHDKRAV